MEIKDWLSINKVEGEGSQKVTLTASQNDGEDRTAKLVVKKGNKNILVNVRQLKKSGSFMWYYKSVKPIPQGGATANDVLGIFTSTAPCTLIRADIYLNTELGMGFVQEETLEMNEGTDYIILNAESNNKDGETQPIRFVQYLVIYEGVNYGVINIPQQGVTPSFSVEPNEIEFYKEGGSKTVEITSNTNWMLWYENRQNEHHHSRNVGTSGTTTVTIYADEYNGVEEIVSNIRIGLPYYNQFSVPFTITQTAENNPAIPENCFYVEPLTAEGTTITPEDSVSYFQNGVWNELTASNSIRITKKTYLKNYNNDATEYEGFKLIGSCNVGGNIETLIGEMREDYAHYLFENCDIVDASNLILPATTLADWCYYAMFSGCTSLVKAPQLPATTLADWCYMYMFHNCKSLVVAPQLPATTLRESCYKCMFDGCTSLTTAPKELPATELAENCYSNMFSECTSLVNAPEELPATTLADYCYAYMFFKCTSLVNAPEELPATILEDYCYCGMFEGCTSLVNVPKELPATESYHRCCYYMFTDCTSLVKAPQLPATTLATECYAYMFAGCKSLVNAPELPATTLQPECYAYMFSRCSKINHIKMLATAFHGNLIGGNPLTKWVNGVSPTGTFYKNPNMDISNFSRGADGIPYGWEVRDADL